MAYQITRRQSTFWDVQQLNGALMRIHFLDKEEFCFVEPLVSDVLIVDDHALLIDYKFGWSAIYLAGPVAVVEDVLAHLAESIEQDVRGWRSPAHYFNDYGAERVLREGYGKLLRAPAPIAQRCRGILDEVGANYSLLGEGDARWPRQALIAGQNFVVAKSFRVEAVT